MLAPKQDARMDYTGTRYPTTCEQEGGSPALAGSAEYVSLSNPQAQSNMGKPTTGCFCSTASVPTAGTQDSAYP